MKLKTYIILAASALMLATTACDDFLEEENKAGATAELTYNSKAGIDGLIGSCYSYARGWYGKEAGLGLSEMGTDLFYFGYDNKQKSMLRYSLSPISLEGNGADNPTLDHYWELFYCAVDVCNTAIKYVPLNTVIAEKLKSQYLAEAHFLRAFYYLHMVNTWGPIPYNSEPISSSTITTAPVKSSEEVIYSNILSDLDNSIAEFEAAGYILKKEGRANYWAARALKARVLLYAASWLGKNSISTNTSYAGKDLYAAAQAEAEAVIGSGIASFYTNYADTWSMTNEDVTVNKEAIWGVTYSSDLTTTSNCIPKRYRKDANNDPLDYNGLITRTGYGRGGNAMLLMFVSMWNNGENDLGGNGKEIFVRVLGESTSTMKNTKTGATVNVAATYSPYGRGFCRYLPSLYLWQLLDRHRATDQRTNATLLEAYTIAPGLEGSAKKYPNIKDTAIYYCALDGDSPEGIAKQAWAKNRYRIQFMYNGDIPVYSSGDPAKALPIEDLEQAERAKISKVYGDNRYAKGLTAGWKSYPGIKKFLDNVYDPKYPTHDISSRDAIVMRLAEMYLIKAECQLYTGGDAMATINELRKVRAIPGTDNSLTGTATLETILEERAVELCGEQQRWFDLKRTKTLVSRVKAYNAQGSANIKDYHYLRPIPQAQMDAITNKNEFLQNDGYNN